MDECYVAYRSVVDISNFTQNPIELPCIDDNPNYCFANTLSKKIFFTKANCAPDFCDDNCRASGGGSPPYKGLICKMCRGKNLQFVRLGAIDCIELHFKKYLNRFY